MTFIKPFFRAVAIFVAGVAIAALFFFLTMMFGIWAFMGFAATYIFLATLEYQLTGASDD